MAQWDELAHDPAKPPISQAVVGSSGGESTAA